MQGRNGKLTIEQWIAFWFRGRSKYHVSRKSDKDNRIPYPRILSSIIDTGARGWGNGQIIFDEVGVAIGQRTETFLTAFLFCWLCVFILLVRDTGCIRPDTFSVTSFMASGVGYCLPTTILASVYKGLNEISYSLHPGSGGGYFPAHFLYAWLAKNFDAYELVGEASSSASMVKFSGLGQAKLFQLEEARELIWDEGKSGSKLKLKIVRSGKPLEPFILPMKDVSFRVKISEINVIIPMTPIPTIPFQSIVSLPQDELPIGVCEPSTENVIELP
ncbi:hypothetical protein Cgig2_000649 [Carnegiea gigantea]|uniref:Uncharacterized protein n=1 Tax=Carnegiea gigantea TaxID=171969 RepID=A0A9Q1JJG6_9CARY|nr:hypothetical protein Cgig2_000649 [Carnegiea gigantea]